MSVQRFEGGAKKTLGGFREFLLRGNVVDLAVGVMIGAAFTAVVTALVNDIITPVIPVAGTGLNSWYTIDPLTHNKIMVGAFIQALISFIILAFVIYFFIVLPVNALMNRYKPHETPAEPAPTRDCPYCLQSVPAAATRCMYCTSPLPPPAPAQPAPPAQQR